MAFRVQGDDGIMVGEALIVIVPAPLQGTTHTVRTMTVTNNDSTAHTVEFMLVNTLSQRKLPFRPTLKPGDGFFFGEHGEMIVLDSPQKSIQARITESVQQDQPDWTSSWGTDDGR